MTERTVILHYHLFKNAGTSFDAILKRNFPGRWVTAEFDQPDNADRVAQWIADNPRAAVFSSHTANGPAPRIRGVRVISALFLRDPVARIRSAYQFERAQAPGNAAEGLGTRLARQSDFGGYVRGRLAVPGDRQCRDFHVGRLARFVPGPGEELERAIAALEVLDFVGRVESFDYSIERFRQLLRPVWPQFTAPALHLNRSGEKPRPATDDPGLLALLEQSNRQDRALIAAAERSVWAGWPAE